MERKKPKKVKKTRAKKPKGDPRLYKATAADRDRILFSFYCGINPDIPHQDKCGLVSDEFDLNGAEAVRVHGSRHKWRDRYKTYLEEYAQRQKEYKLQIRSPETGMTVEIEVSELSKDVKGAARDSLKAARMILETATSMIQYYGILIKTKVESKGGIAMLTTFDMVEIEGWSESIHRYQKRISDFLKPSSVATLLKMIGLDYLGDGEEVDGSALTMAALQERVLQLGMRSAFDDTDKTDTVFKEYAEQEGVELPNIEGYD